MEEIPRIDEPQMTSRIEFIITCTLLWLCAAAMHHFGMFLCYRFESVGDFISKTEMLPGLWRLVGFIGFILYLFLIPAIILLSLLCVDFLRALWFTKRKICNFYTTPWTVQSWFWFQAFCFVQSKLTNQPFHYFIQNPKQEIWLIGSIVAGILTLLFCLGSWPTLARQRQEEFEQRKKEKKKKKMETEAAKRAKQEKAEAASRAKQRRIDAAKRMSVNTADDMVARGNAYFAEDCFQEAMENFMGALHLDPNHSEAILMMGRAEAKLED